MGKNGSKFSHLLTVRAEVADPPPLTVRLTVKYPFLGPQGPHEIPLSVRLSVSRSVRKKNMDHMYTGIYAS